MAGKSDIEAARAFVALFIKDQGWSKGLKAAGQELRSWGKGIALFGAAVSAAGSAVVTPLLAMASKFAETGSAIFDMAQRTNKGVKALQEYAYAAEQTGTSMEKVEAAIHKARKEGKDFDELADKIAAIEDPAKQSQKAIELFGKKLGPALVPMIRDLPALRRRFNELGIGISKEAAARADTLGDAFADLKLVIKSTSDAIGDALAPALTTVIDAVTKVAIRVRDWVRENNALFKSMLKVGAVTVASGAAVTGLGAAMGSLGTALEVVNSALGATSKLMAFLLSPVGLVTSAIAGLGYWFVTSTKWGREMVTALAGWFGELRDYAVEAFGGISDALANGNMALAAEIALGGVKLVFVKAVNALAVIWAGFIELGNRTTGSFERGWITAVETIGNFWDNFVDSLKMRLNELMGWFQKVWAFFRHFTGDVAGEFEKIDREVAATNDVLLAERNAKISARSDNAERQRKRSLETQTGATNVIGADLDNGQRERLAKARAEFEASTRKAAEERKKFEAKGAPKFEGGGGPGYTMTGDSIKSQVFGSFSAAALSAGGAGGGDPTTKELREQRGIHLANLKELMAIRGRLKQRGLR